MKVSTKYFGEVEYTAEDVLHFAKGLFAFEEEKEFLLLPFGGDDAPLLCLQSTQTAGLAFVAMNPFTVAGGYAPELRAEELRALGVEDSRDLCYYVLCVVKEPVSESTLNLKCPVVINDRTREAAQVILEGQGYGMRHRLSELAEGGVQDADPPA